MKNTLKKRYRHNLSLLTDLYQLTMAYGYWKNRMHDNEAVFHLFFRKTPFNGRFTVASGLEEVMAYLEDLAFGVEDIQYLGSLTGNDGLPLFEEGFLNYLQRMTFSCDVEAVPEGTVVFPHQPILRIKGPLIQAQLIETALLNIVNFQTLIATKAARTVLAAKGDTVLEFGLRRAQGIDGGLSASRAAYIGGCHATSNVLAGKLFDIPVRGTHAHSWVMCHEDEEEAFEAYAQTMPNNCVFLVDTYDTIEGVKKAIRVGERLRTKGFEMAGIRLDSGDLAALSKAARLLLDAAGFEQAQIVASDSLDEYAIEKLKAEGAQISVWGVGTRLVTAFDQPALGGVYKLAALRKPNEAWQYKIKRSETLAKISTPGVLNVWRFSDAEGVPVADMLFDESQPTPAKTLIDAENHAVNCSAFHKEKLLLPIFEKGKKVYDTPSIHETRDLARRQTTVFAQKAENQITGLEVTLHERKMELLEKCVVG